MVWLKQVLSYRVVWEMRGESCLHSSSESVDTAVLGFQANQKHYLRKNNEEAPDLQQLGCLLSPCIF